MEELFVSFMTNCPATCCFAQGRWVYLHPLILATCHRRSLDSLWRGKEALPKHCRVFWCYCISTPSSSRQGPNPPAICKWLQKYLIRPKPTSHTTEVMHPKETLNVLNQHRGVQPRFSGHWGLNVYMQGLYLALWLYSWEKLLAKIWGDSSKS